MPALVCRRTYSTSTDGRAAPLVGRVIGDYAQNRFTRTLATLQAGGIPLVTSIELAGGAVGNVIDRIVYGVVVALAGAWLIFERYTPEGLMIALFCASPFVPWALPVYLSLSRNMPTRTPAQIPVTSILPSALFVRETDSQPVPMTVNRDSTPWMPYAAAGSPRSPKLLIFSGITR